MIFRKPTAFVEKGLASDIYHLQEIGIPVADNQAELTPFQRQVLVKEKIRQNEKEKEQMEQAGGSGASPSRPQQMSGGTPNARSSRIQAIEESQSERDRFVNKKVVDE